MTQFPEIDLLEEIFSSPSSATLPDEFLHELVLKGGIALLEDIAGTNPGYEHPVLLLYAAAATNRFSSGIRRQAFQSLARLSQSGNSFAIDKLFLLAVEKNYLPAIQVILAQKYTPSCPELQSLLDWFILLPEKKPFPQAQLQTITRAYFEIASSELRKRLIATAADLTMQNWAEIVTLLADDSPVVPEGLVTLFPTLRPAERDLTIRLLTQRAEQNSRAAQEVICLLFIYHEDSQAKETALLNGYLPQDLGRRAVFYFLAQDWDAYNRLDFDHSMIANFYEAADRGLRHRLMEHSRKTGQIEWLQKPGATGEVRWISDLTDADWDLAIRRLSEKDQYTDLFRLSQSSPPHWSAEILVHLASRGWLPDHSEDRDGFHKLVTHAQDCLQNPLVVRTSQSLKAATGELTCMAIHTGKKILAVGSSEQSITLWDLSKDTPETAFLMSPAPVTRAIAFSPDGEMLASASGDHRIRIFRLNGGQIQKTLEGHRSMIRSLIPHPDGRILFSGGYDGQIRMWRFPFGPELKTIHPDTGEILQLALGTGGHFLISAGINGMVQIWSLPDGSAARQIQAHSSPVTHLAASSNSEIVASAGRDGWIRVWNYNSGGLLRSINTASDLVTSLAFLPNDLGLVSGHQSGQITLWSLSTGKEILQLRRHLSTVNGLTFLPDDYQLYSSDNRGNIFSWELQIFLMMRLPGLVRRPGMTAGFQELQKRPGLTGPESKWLAFAMEMLLWRQRYDIELADISYIEIGEFDIELS